MSSMTLPLAGVAMSVLFVSELAFWTITRTVVRASSWAPTCKTGWSGRLGSTTAVGGSQ
jgi:hypothetical protein